MPTAVYDDAGNFLGIRRLLAGIYADVAALTGAQKAAVWADLSAPVTAGTVSVPRKFLADDGNNAAAIFALDWAWLDSGTAQSAKTSAQLRIISAYVQDNPRYLEHPDFDPSINIPGYVPNPPASE